MTSPTRGGRCAGECPRRLASSGPQHFPRKGRRSEASPSPRSPQATPSAALTVFSLTGSQEIQPCRRDSRSSTTMSPSAGRHRSPDVVRLSSGRFRARRGVGELERAWPYGLLDRRRACARDGGSRPAKDSEATERALMFLQALLPDGIEPADPMIQFRNKTYPVSYQRRH